MRATALLLMMTVGMNGGGALGCEVEIGTFTLFLNASSQSPASECQSFAQLSSALSQASVFSLSFLVFPSTAEALTLTVDFSLPTRLEVQGSARVLRLQRPIYVLPTALLVVRNLTIETANQTISAGFLVYGRLQLMEVRTALLATPLIESSAGEIALVNCEMKYQAESLIVIDSICGEVVVTACEVQSSGGGFVEVLQQPVASTLNLNITQTRITGVASAALEFLSIRSQRTGLLGLTIVTVLQCDFRDSEGSLIGGSLEYAEITIANTDIDAVGTIVAGSLFNANVTFTNCRVTNIRRFPLTLDSLLGYLSVLHSQVSGLAQGPLFHIANNQYSPALAFFVLQDCKVWNVSNSNYRPPSGIVSADSVTVWISDVEVWNMTILRDGFLMLVAGVAQLSSILYRDSAVSLTNFMDVSSSTITVRNVTVLRVTNTGAVTVLLSATAGLWDNVSIIDPTDPRPIVMKSLVVLWVGFGGQVTVTRSYIRSTSYVGVTMAATNYGELNVSDSLFADSNCQRGFDAFIGGKVNVDNVTFANLTAGAILNCAQTEPCGTLRNIHFSGPTRLQSLFSLTPGQVTLVDNCFQGVSFSVIRALSSVVTVRNATFRGAEFVFCKECIDSTVDLSNSTFEAVTSDTLFSLRMSKLGLRDVRITGVRAAQLFDLDAANLTAVRVTVSDCNLDSFGGLITSSPGSVVAISDSAVQGVLGRLSFRDGLLSLDSSRLVVTCCEFAHFNSTLIYSRQSSLSISQSEFRDGGLLSQNKRSTEMFGGVIRDDSSLQVDISNVTVRRVAADYGGAFYFSHARETDTQYHLRRVYIVHCSAAVAGGAVFAKSVSVAITEAVFEGNSAQFGGGVWTSSVASLVSLSDSQFISNSASVSGGAVQYFYTAIVAKNVVMKNNSALYGAEVASSVSRISYIDESLRPQNNSEMVAASGQKLPRALLFGLFDEIGQLVSTDNSTQLTLSSSSGSRLEGSTLLYPLNGVYHAASLTVVAEPLANVTLYAETNSMRNAVLKFHMRLCSLGESYDHSRCRLCTNNMYSLDPTEPCRLCPAQAECTDGYKLSLSPGYWRSSTLTDVILKCLVDRVCLGGFDSDCLEGHVGRLCEECADGYVKSSQMLCLSCTHAAVTTFKGLSILAAALAGVGLIVFAAEPVKTTAVVLLDYLRLLRVLANLNMHWPPSVLYLLLVLGDLGSAGLTSFTNVCFPNLSRAETAYFHVLLALLHFLIIAFLLPVVSLVATVFSSLLPMPKLQVAVFHLIIAMLPLLFLLSLELFACMDIEGEHRLVFEPAVQCWTAEHYKYSLAIAVPVFVVYAVAIGGIAVHAKVKSCRWLPETSHSDALFLLLLHLKTCAIIPIVTFSSSFSLVSQSALTILILFCTDFIFQFTSCHRGTPMLKLTLSTTIVFCFLCVILDTEGHNHFVAYDAALILLCYALLPLPLYYGVAVSIIRRQRMKCAQVQPTTLIVPHPEDSQDLFVPPPTVNSEQCSLNL